MSYLAAVLDLCVWAGEGFGGLDKWLSMPENERAIWFEHWNNVRSNAYAIPEPKPESRAESLKKADTLEAAWLERCRRNAKK